MARKTTATNATNEAIARRKASLPRRLFETARALEADHQPYNAALSREAARAVRDGRKDLSNLTTAVYVILGKLDAAMKSPSTVDRGKVIAALANDLQMAADRAWHFGLGNDLPGPTGGQR